MTEITSKEQNIAAWTAGAFGNTLRVWPSIGDAVADHSFDGPWVLRSRRVGGTCIYNILTRRRLEKLGRTYSSTDCYVNEGMPDQLITIQGELERRPEGLYLFYSDLKGHMRDCLRKRPLQAHGLAAKILLELRCHDYVSVLWDLLDEYPDHIIEFSAFSLGVGKLGWPLIVWEVRKY